MNKEWYEIEGENGFLTLEKEFIAGLPEGTVLGDSYQRVLWCAYRSGVNDGKNGTGCI